MSGGTHSEDGGERNGYMSKASSLRNTAIAILDELAQYKDLGNVLDEIMEDDGIREEMIGAVVEIIAANVPGAPTKKRP